MNSGTKERVELRDLVARWRDKAVRWSLAGPTVNGQTVDALRYCADELEAALAAVEREGPREAAIRLEEAQRLKTVLDALESILREQHDRIAALERAAQSPVAGASEKEQQNGG